MKNNTFKWKDAVGILLRGMGMGAADIVPGVSGGTIALLTGIYPRLIQAIKNINMEALKLLFKGKIKELWAHIDGWFLSILACGIGVSIFSLAKIMDWLLQHHPILVWSFFFGLILASTVVVLKKIKKRNFWAAVFFTLGAVAAYFLTRMVPVPFPDMLPFVFLSGFIAICAMILPGISGSFILVILGHYALILSAVNDLRIGTLLVFMAGCLCGLMAFSRVLGYVLKRWWDKTVAVLAGFMLGSLNKVWPWKQTLQSYADRHGELVPLVQKNILPAKYEMLTGEPSRWLPALLLCLAGIGLVILAEYMSRPKAVAVEPGEK